MSIRRDPANLKPECLKISYIENASTVVMYWHVANVAAFLGVRSECKPTVLPAHCSAASLPACSTLLRAVLNFPANIRSSGLRLRASHTAEFGCWMVNCASESSGFSILAGARVRQAACFAVPGCLGYCCAFYRYLPSTERSPRPVIARLGLSLPAPA